MTEYMIQLFIFRHLLPFGNNLIIPNIQIQFGEADMLKITKAGYAMEYEIKTNKIDFKNDSKKIQKHNQYKEVFNTTSKDYVGIPNYFTYVVPEHLIAEEEIPDYAGLSFIRNNGVMYVVKIAPKIHKHKQSEYWNGKAAKSLSMRYYYNYFRHIQKEQVNK